jgi:lipopolysaccharide transport system ATP-binding protein
MASIILRDVCLDYPLYGAYDFSLKRRLLGRLARRLGSDPDDQRDRQCFN